MRASIAAASLAVVILIGVPPALSAAGAPAESTAAQRTSVAVTVYNVNLALVRETRTLQLDRAGVSELRFMDVPSAIDPKTVHLEVPDRPGSLSVLEQNYEYDLISPDKLMEKYVGRKVELVEQAEDLSTRTVPAVLLSVNGGPIYKIGDRIVLNQHGKVTLPSLPEDLVSRPTLVWLVKADRAGERKVEASYLTGGMNWSADYVAVVNAADDRADLTGWVTVENRSGATFHDATLKLVAGNVRRVTPSRPVTFEAKKRNLVMAPGAEGFTEEGFFEYHLYTLQRPTDLKNNQTKQLSLFQTAGVPVRKELLLVGQPAWYRNQYGTLDQSRKVSVVLKFDNRKQDGLGIPLPKGTVRVYKKDRSGAEQFVGEDAIDHTPKDETVRLTVGQAFDVVADRKQTDFQKLGRRFAESAFEIVLRNHKDEKVTVVVREPLGGDWTVVSSSNPWTKRDARTLEFRVEVPPNGTVPLTYRVRVRW